ncbi:MAG: hypothetical protein JO008_10775 [Alphaproteobacteria bacterium]|nr:hypothetical protein [Alphaproteobacteria bacterium]
MIVAVFRGVKWLHAELHRRIGPAYNVILGIGLVIEIIHRVREANFHADAGVIRFLLAVVLFALLLLSQLAELGEHVERRRLQRRERTAPSC